MPVRVLVLGSSGMAGHVVTSYLKDVCGHEVLAVGPRRVTIPGSIQWDVEDLKDAYRILGDFQPTVVVNCLGVLVKASEEHRYDAVLINALIPHFLAKACKGFGARLIHLSTDCVFSGERGPYAENDLKDGEAFYDRSKALGEILDGANLTIRTSIIGPELKTDGTGLFDWIMRQTGEVSGFSRALWSGVTTLELARFIAYCITDNKGLSGLVHFSVEGGISKFELLQKIATAFNKTLVVKPVSEPVLDKRLVCTRTDLGISARDYSTQLTELRVWMEKYPEYYASYLENL